MSETDNESIFSNPETPDADAINLTQEQRESLSPENGTVTELDTGDVDLNDHSDVVSAMRNAEEEAGVVVPPLPEESPIPTPDPFKTADPQAAINEELQRRFSSELGDDIKVEVTEEEKARFVRCALHDQEMYFDVEIEGVGASLRVAMPTASFSVEVSGALSFFMQEDNGTDINVSSDMSWLMMFQKMHAWYQIRSIMGTPTKWSDFWVDGIPKTSKIRKALKKPETYEFFETMNATRWRLIIEAMNVAEIKYGICLKAWHDRSFFASADSA